MRRRGILGQIERELDVFGSDRPSILPAHIPAQPHDHAGITRERPGLGQARLYLQVFIVLNERRVDGEVDDLARVLVGVGDRVQSREVGTHPDNDCAATRAGTSFATSASR